MSNTESIREAPFSFIRTDSEQSYPDAPVEPVLNLNNIQGNIIGFNKDYQTFIFLKISEIEVFRRWLGQFVPFVATARDLSTLGRRALFACEDKAVTMETIFDEKPKMIIKCL